MKSQLFKINQLFAQKNKLPVYFVGVKLTETAKAVYLYGRGTTSTKQLGACSICGRALTHPVSIELGVGPECGAHFWDWDRVGGYTKENIARLTKMIEEKVIIDQWFPKSVIKEEHEIEETVQIPENHPKIKPKETTMEETKKAVMAVNNATKEYLIKVNFPYDIETLFQIKGIYGRKYYGEDAVKFWTIPLSVENVESLIGWKFELDVRLKNYLAENKTPTGMALPAKEIKGLKEKLFPFQQRGVDFIESRKGRALIADEMGLGKTVQALAWLQLHPELRPAIIVVPASLKLNWEKEAVKWMYDPKVQILAGTNPIERITGKLVIINYDILHAWVDKLKSIRPKALITDECHYYKSNKTNRTKAVKAIGKGIPHVIALSGTPIVNRPIEMYNAINLVNPNIVPNFTAFTRFYCNAKFNGYGWDYNGASNTEHLHKLLTSSIMLRRLKSEVLSDLPDKTRNYIPMALDNWTQYREAERNFIAFVREMKGTDAAIRASNAAALAEIEGLKQLAVHGKLKQAIEWIDDFLDVGGKLVVFAVHKFVIDALTEHYGNKTAVKIDGSVTMAERNNAVDRFQNDPSTRLFVGNIKAAGVGLTLTAASNVCFLELPWTPGDLAQAEDRCHRIGQKDNVMIHYLLAANTIEEKIARLIDKKRKVLDAVLDGVETDSKSLLSELMEEYEDER